MAGTFNIFTDSNLVSPLAGNLLFRQAADNSIAPDVQQVWIGSTTSNRQLRAASNPGVDQLTLSINDSNAGSGEPVTAFKLFVGNSPPADWNAITAGASVNLGTQLLSGLANALSIFIWCDDQTAAAGNYTDVTLDVNDAVEDVV